MLSLSLYTSLSLTQTHAHAHNLTHTRTHANTHTHRHAHTHTNTILTTRYRKQTDDMQAVRTSCLQQCTQPFHTARMHTHTAHISHFDRHTNTHAHTQKLSHAPMHMHTHMLARSQLAHSSHTYQYKERDARTDIDITKKHTHKRHSQKEEGRKKREIRDRQRRKTPATLNFVLKTLFKPT